LIRRIDGIPRYLETARTNLLTGKQSGNIPDWRMIERDGINGSLGNAEYFRQSLPASAAAYLGRRPFAPILMSQLRQAGEKAAAAYEDFATFVQSTFGAALKSCVTDVRTSDVGGDRLQPGRGGGCTDRFAVGAEEYEWRVRNVLRDPRSASALDDYGAQQVQLYSSRIRDIADVIAKEAGWGKAALRDVVNHLAKDSPQNDDELFAWYRDAAARAVAYGRQQAMFDIPQAYKLDIVPTPPVLQASIDAAYYPAPPFKKTGWDVSIFPPRVTIRQR
jgi:hypothetical protein